MALRSASLSAAIYDLLPHALNSPQLFQMRTATQLYRFLSSPLLPSAALSIPSISLNIPDLLGDIWEGILKAVPKKKTSHMKKRHRQLAGKALKDVNSINTCPACRKPKRAHLLCPYCVEGKFRSILDLHSSNIGYRDQAIVETGSEDGKRRYCELWRCIGTVRYCSIAEVEHIA
jgi:large subunit ribosomal protein L32